MVLISKSFDLSFCVCVFFLCVLVAIFLLSIPTQMCDNSSRCTLFSVQPWGVARSFFPYVSEVMEVLRLQQGRRGGGAGVRGEAGGVLLEDATACQLYSQIVVEVAQLSIERLL